MVATEAGGQPPAPAQGSDKKEKKDQTGQNNAKPAAGPSEKKLSGAELKKKAKEEKAARRAQAKAAQVVQAPAQGQQPGGEGKGAKGKGKQDAYHNNAKLPLRPAQAPAVLKETKPTIPECFSHLSMAKRIPMTQADKDVHPVVLNVGEHMACFAITDSTTRLETTLLAFKRVIIPRAA